MLFKLKTPKTVASKANIPPAESKTVSNSSGESIGISGHRFRPHPIFNEEGRLVGFSRELT